jgi:hypothetical protein
MANRKATVEKKEGKVAILKAGKDVGSDRPFV